MEFTKIEIRGTFLFLTLQGQFSTQVQNQLRGVYGDRTASFPTICYWFRHFKCGGQSIEDAPRSGRTISVTSDYFVKKVKEVVEFDKRATMNQIACEVGISYGSVFRILHKEPGLSKLFAR